MSFKRRSVKAHSILSDALSFVGCAGYQVSLKHHYLLKPELSKGFQSLCAVSTPVTTQLLGDDLSKNVDDISKANRIATKLTSSDRGARYTKYCCSTSTQFMIFFIQIVQQF